METHQDHQPHGQHHHHHHDGDDAEFTEANRNHWDSMAKKYDVEQWQKDMLNSIHGFILENIQWIGVPFVDPSSSFENAAKTDRPIRVLDYACGPGTITNILYSHANEFVGIDLSQAMVDEYNRRFSHTLPSEIAQTNARAVVGNLIDLSSSSTISLPEAEKGSFDLVAVGLGFHHFSNVKVATERLTEYVRPGGVFMIVDFLTHQQEAWHHPSKHTVAHHGFDEDRIKDLFSGAGLTDVKIKVMPEPVLMRGEDKRVVFMARGIRQ